MRIERLFNILLYLLNHQKVTAAQLSEFFQVSKRTIYRDIDTLSSSGVPLFTVLGVNGGIQLMENYRLNRFTFSEAEKNILIQSLNTQHTLIETDKATELVYKINRQNIRRNYFQFHADEYCAIAPALLRIMVVRLQIWQSQYFL